MNTIKSILALANTGSHHQYALDKAIYLADRGGAHITLLDLEPSNSHLFFQGNRNTHQQEIERGKLETLVSELRANGINIELKYRESSREFKGVMQELNDHQYDLIIKNTQPHHNPYLGFSITDDWHLLRDINNPLLLVGAKSWQTAGHILAAIDLDESDAHHDEFNFQILESSGVIARLLETDIHLLNCYLGEDCSMAIRRENNQGMHLTQREKHELKLKAYSKHLNLSNEYTHVELGMPDDVIPVMAEKYQANILVMGAGEHHGLFSSIAGHTSEYVIDQLSCDVLALKPEQLAMH